MQNNFKRMRCPLPPCYISPECVHSTHCWGAMYHIFEFIKHTVYIAYVHSALYCACSHSKTQISTHKCVHYDDKTEYY